LVGAKPGKENKKDERVPREGRANELMNSQQEHLFVPHDKFFTGSGT
jgi:hypothetical protein